MTKQDTKYESIYIIDASLDEEARTAVADRFKALVESHGTLEKVDDWGKRRFAYPINDMTEGHYLLMQFSAPADFPRELDRIYNITDAVLRSLTIKLDA